jgi:hypothetical protein
LLIDLCEGMAARAAKGLRKRTSDPKKKQEWEQELMLRVKALTAPGLPRCFTAGRHTMNMVNGKSTCDFHLCDHATAGSAGHRIISRSFAERAQRTAGARLAFGGKDAFVRGRFADVWRHIWELTPLELSPRQLGPLSHPTISVRDQGSVQRTMLCHLGTCTWFSNG